MSHNEEIVAQFTRMADAFASAPRIVDRQALDLLLRQTGAGATDTSLDVACGAGVVACHFATVVDAATGIDLTPAMIDKARALQRSRGLGNVKWDVGDVMRLPYANDVFSIVTCRYAFHHVLAPAAVLAEIMRACRPGGVIAVADICVPEEAAKATRFDQIERLNDPTHARALPLSEHLALFRAVGLAEPEVSHYNLDFPLPKLLASMGHGLEQAREVDELVKASIKADELGTGSRVEDGETIFSHPIAVISARKPVRTG